MDKTFTFFKQQNISRKLFCLLVVTVFCLAKTAHAQNTWVKKADFPGVARSTSTNISFSVGNKGYVGLGVGSEAIYTNKFLKDIWEYDPATNSWTQKADFPGSGRIEAIGFSIADKGYVGMGYNNGYSNTSGFLNDFYEFDPLLNTWSKKADYLGGGLAATVGFSIGNKGYMGTGWTGENYKKDFYEYDPLKDKWTRKADFAGDARGFATGFAIGTKGYIGTGKILAEPLKAPVRDFWEYDTLANNWTRKADFGLYGTYDAAGFNIGSKGYIGNGITADSPTYLFYEYNPIINQWISIAGFPSTGTRFDDNDAAFSINGKGYVGIGHFSYNNFYEYTPCGDKNFKAAFDFVQSNYQANFTTQKVAGVKYLWDFGDGKQDTSAIVFHKYDSFASYRVKLIASNACYTDTTFKNITVAGLTSIYTNHGGNTGTVTVDVKGAGFIAGTKLFLDKNGEQISGDTLIIQNSGSMSTTFDLSNKTLGLYNVITILPSGKTDTLKNGFTIENGNSAKLNVDISGSNILRIGFNQVYSVTCTNSGNTDAEFIPLLVTGLPLGTEIELLNPLFKINSITGLETLDITPPNNSYTVHDTLNNMSLRSFFLPNIPAGSVKILNFVFHIPDNSQLGSTPQIKVTLGKPASTSFKSSNNGIKSFSISADDVNCFAKINEIVQSKVYDFLNKTDPSGIIKCLSLVQKNSKYVIDHFTSKSVNTNRDDLDAKGYIVAMAQMTSSCLRATMTIGTIASENPLLIPEIIKINSLLLAYEIALDKASAPLKYAEYFTALNDCLPTFAKVAEYVLSTSVGNSTDPNQKYGSGDASDNHFTNQRSLLNYTINFENKPEANLNAQTVTVIDTLKKDYFNLNTFGFTSVIIGDSTLNFSSPVKSFIHDFDFTSKYNLKARVVASFDTISGIAKWKFYTIDPATNQVTNKALDGFLPPDVKSPEGQGYVSYKISPKAGLGTGDMIQNKAYITFDYNTVIPTNAWNNTFDFVAPVSKIEPLAATTTDSTFVVHWGGSDNLSGIARYNISYAVGNGLFQTWLNGTSATSAKFTGQKDSTYKFYSIAMDNAGNTESAKSTAEASITVKVPKNQLIKFPQIASKTFGDADFDPGATVGSSLPITYTTNNTAVATIVNGKLHIVGAGTVIITASQAGNQDYNAALPVNDTLTVKKASQTLTFPTILFKNYKDPDFNPGATSTSGLPVTYTSSNTFVFTVVNGQLHIVTSGTSTITATQAGNANYLSATSISQDIQVIFSLPANNFTISAISASCKGSSNGEIDLAAASSQNYTATVTSGASTTTYPFTGQFSIKNLPAGTYSVCVTIADYPAFKQCFDVVVTEPKDLSVYSVVNPTLGTLSLSLAGASSYNITLNGTAYTTTQSNITLPLEPGSNTVKVTTASICQGIYEKTIELPPGVLAYPNPFERTLSLSIGNDRSSTATIEVYDIKGQKVYAGKSSINQGICSLDLGNLASGSYMLKLILDHSETHLKIVKK